MYLTLLNAFRETVILVTLSGLLSILIGVPLGLSVIGCSFNKSISLRGFSYIAKYLLATIHTIPAVLLMLLCIPLAFWLKSLIPASPFAISIYSLGLIGGLLLAHQIQKSLSGLPKELIESVQSMGANAKQLIYHVILPEQLSTVIKLITHVLSLLVSLSLVAGILGAGGLGTLIFESLKEPQYSVLIAIAAALLVVFHQTVIHSGLFLAEKLVKR